MATGLVGFDIAANRFESDRVHGAYLPGDVNAAREGVKADGSTDNTAALVALAQKYAHPEFDYSRTRIHLPENGTVMGRLPLVRGVEWWGGTLAYPGSNNSAGHLIYPLDPAWTTNPDGSGAHRSGIRHMTVIGRRSELPEGVCPMPPTSIATQPSNTGGTLAAGDYVYALAYANDLGTGFPSEPVWGHVASGTTGSVKITWANTEQWSEWPQIVIYGRGGGRYGWEPLAKLAAGTTSWTDTGGAKITGVNRFTFADLSGASCILNGAAHHVEDVTFTDLQGSVLSDWRAPQSIPNEPDYSCMEGIWKSVRVQGANGSVVSSGPHDSQISDIIIAHAGEGHPGRTPAFVSEAGNLDVTQMHVWGNHGRGISVVAGPTSFTDCKSEGHSEAALYVEWSDVTWNGGRMFWPNGANARGIVAGPGASVVANGVDFYMFSSSTGAAVDLTGTDKYCKVVGRTSQPSGTVVAGLNTARHDVKIIQTQNGGPASVINNLTSYTA